MLSKPQYLFPRLSIFNIPKSPNNESLINNLQAYHGKYYNIFNLTNISFDKKLPQTKFKWRGVPFSISQAIKILNKLDQYLRTNKGNSVVFCVFDIDSYLFVKILVREYVKICKYGIEWDYKNQNVTQILQSLIHKISNEHKYFSQNLLSIYHLKSIHCPPIKIISSFSLNTQKFIPIFQIYQQTRFNDFQLIYTHQIQNQLAQYYFNKNKPLQLTNSIGQKFYDRKPQKKYLNKPVIICGDVKIVCYSFNTLERKKQFIIGFNTKKMIFSQEIGENQGIINFKYNDTYERSCERNLPVKDINIVETKINQKLEAFVKIQNYCQNLSCAYESKCQECQQQSRKIQNRYNQIQTDLNKLIRQRNVNQIKDYLSLK